MSKWILVGLVCLLSGCAFESSIGLRTKKTRFVQQQNTEIKYQNEYLGIR